MKMDKVASSGNDEFYTPSYAVKPIMKYIPTGSRIWCPFDTKDSLFVREFSGGGITLPPLISSTEKIFLRLTRWIAIILSVIRHIASRVMCCKDCLTSEHRLRC